MAYICKKEMAKDEKEKDTEPFQIEQEQELYGEHAVDCYSDLDTGWAWAVLFASFGTFCVIGGNSYAVGIVHAALIERYSENVAVTSWAGALHAALYGLGGPLASAVIDRYSCRAAIVLSGLLFVIGFIATAFAKSIELAIFTYGVLAGTGGALGFTTAMVVVSFNFNRRRNLALGIALSGAGIGVFILSPLMQLARDVYGPTGFFFVLAAIAANVITFGAMCFPSKLEIHTRTERELELRKSRGEKAVCTSLKLYFHILFNKAVICLCASMFCHNLGVSVIYLYLPSYIVSKGFTAMEAAFIVSLSGIITVFGRLLTGFVANLNRINVIHLFSGSMGVVAIASFIYPFMSSHFAGHVIYVILFGLFFGSCYVIATAVTLPFVGVYYMSAAIGLLFFFGGVGSITGPVFAGFLVDITGTYEQSIIIAASCFSFSAVSSLVTVCCKRKVDDVLQKDESIRITLNQSGAKEQCELIK